MIKGINLGGWLLMEGYMLGGRNISEHIFKQQFCDRWGKKELQRFETLFRDTFITEDDFKRIAQLGANTIRLPFNYRLIEQKPFSYSSQGAKYLQKALDWGQKHNIKVILDLHAAPGAQNCDWHGDSTGRALLWQDRECQQRTYELWHYLADRFGGHPALLGYDVLNEPVLGKKSPKVLQRVYKGIIKHIRQVDKKSVIFLEGALWAQRIDFLAELLGENISVSIHCYVPLDYALNFRPYYRFPGKVGNVLWSPKRLKRYLKQYYAFAKKHNVDIFCGEFGLTWRGGHWGEKEWLTAILESFHQYRFGYTFWSYKTISINLWPDGVYQYLPNSAAVRREGPVFGWENYIEGWKKERNAIVAAWQTKNYTLNTEYANILRKFYSKSK